MKFKDYITEKLNPSQFRDIVKAWKASGISKHFDHLFGKADRIYEPYEGKAPYEKNVYSVENQLKKHLIFFNTLPEYDYEIKDYKKGIVLNKKNNREIKITKMLDGFIKRCEEIENKVQVLQHRWKDMKEDLIRLKKDFINDPSRSAIKNTEGYLICYSRHAYDVAGMSTDRGWTSCMALPGDKQKPEGGVHSHYVKTEIKDGTIIAYLIKANDKNIQHPIGRILIKPYYNEMQPNDIMMVACSDGYGTIPEGMKKQVVEWTKKLNANTNFGVFRIKAKEFTNVDVSIVTKYPLTIEDCKKSWPVVDVYDDPVRILKYPDVFDVFVSSRWTASMDEKEKRRIKVKETIRNRKLMVFDMKELIKKTTGPVFVSLYKYGFEDADDFGYEITKAAKEMINDESETQDFREMINGIRTLAYYIQEGRYHSDPDTSSPGEYEEWLRNNNMWAKMNVKLYDITKKYYTDLKRNLKK